MDSFGLLGEKLSHSLSPEIHKEILDYINKCGDYNLFEVERGNLEEFIQYVKLSKLKGFNVTIPYKQDIMKHLDSISKEAESIGAVNTVLLKDDKLYGYNTDYFGFGATFERKGISFKDKIAVILGYGGACRAALSYILNDNINKVYIVSRNHKSINLNIEDNRLSVIGYEELNNIKGDVIINSTPVGMYPNNDDSPVDDKIIENFEVVMDIIYNPLETKFLEYGRKKGKITLDGLYMLAAQAVKAQEIFQDMKIDEKIIDNIYESLKKNFK